MPTAPRKESAKKKYRKKDAGKPRNPATPTSMTNTKGVSNIKMAGMKANTDDRLFPITKVSDCPWRVHATMPKKPSKHANR